MTSEPEQIVSPTHWPPKLFLLAAMLVVAGASMLAIDLPVAQFCLKSEESGGVLPGDLRTFLNLTEVFGHGFGIGLIGLSYYFLDRQRRLAVVRIMAGAFGAGFFANVFKMLLISRTRPRAFDFSGDFSGNVMDTFNNWVPLFTSGSLKAALDSSQIGSPSGHTAAAAGLAVMLAWRFPHARWLFALFVVLAALQRIVSGAHFVSDTFWGAAVGCVFGAFCITTNWPGSLFDKIESLEGK